jgi:hypothetical protein
MQGPVQDVPMHLTSGEGPMFGSFAIAASTAFIGFVTLVGTRRREHERLLWERRAEVYEYVLLEAEKLSRERDRKIFPLPAALGELFPELERSSDAAEQDRALVRLRMYGRPAVYKAFSQYLEADRAWAAAVAGWGDLQRLASQATRGEIPEHQAPAAEQVLAAKARVDQAREEADERERRLIRAVHRAVNRVPKPRWWDRLRRRRWSLPPDPPRR